MTRPPSRIELEKAVRDFVGDSLVATPEANASTERAMAVVGILSAYVVGRWQGRRAARARRRRRRS